jgi:hypothetical protein
MPFRSAKQRAYMYAVHPDIAKRWAAEFGNAIVSGGKKPAKKPAKGKQNG